MSHLLNQTILLAIAGSRAHGTATSDSDVDVLGVAVPTRQQALGLFYGFEQENQPEKLKVFVPTLNDAEQRIVVGSKLEGTIYGAKKFLHLATEANPTILELLFCRDSEVRRLTPLGEWLRSHRDLFVTAKCRHTFGGYAASQLSRLRLHYRWHHDGPAGPPARSDYGLPEMSLLPKAQVDAAEAAVRKQMDRWELDLLQVEPAVRIDIENRVARTLTEWGLATNDAKWNAAARWVGLNDNLIEVIQQERRWRTAHKEWQRYRRWLENRNPERAILEAAHGYDTKHGAHLVRLLRMGIEIISTGCVHVWRGEIDAEELRAIRDGEWSYDTLCEWAEQARIALENAQLVVPTHPDRAKIDALCIQLIERGFALEELSA